MPSVVPSQVSINARDDLAALFSRGGNQLIADSFRYIQFERPDKVIDAINEVAAQSRRALSAGSH